MISLGIESLEDKAYHGMYEGRNRSGSIEEGEIVS
jgi:hypothetical protein